MIWLASDGLWELGRQRAVGIWKSLPGKVGEGVGLGGDEQQSSGSPPHFPGLAEGGDEKEGEEQRSKGVRLKSKISGLDDLRGSYLFIHHTDLEMNVVPSGRYRSLILRNPSVQNGNVHSGLCLVKVLRKGPDGPEAFHVKPHDLDLRRLELVPNLLRGSFALLHVPHAEHHSRVVLHVQSSGLEPHPGVRAGDEDRLAGEVDICWDLRDGGDELFEGEGDGSVWVEGEGVLVTEAEREGR